MPEWAGPALRLSLYFASQGAGRLMWPLLGGLLRLLIAVAAGAVALWLTGSLTSVFVMLSIGLATYGLIIGYAVRSGVWFKGGAAG